MEKILKKNCIITETGEVQTIYKCHAVSFNITDSEEPDLYAADAIHKWQTSPKGSFITQHGKNLKIDRNLNVSTMGWTYRITTEMADEHLNIYLLKYGKN